MRVPSNSALIDKYVKDFLGNSAKLEMFAKGRLASMGLESTLETDLTMMAGYLYGNWWAIYVIEHHGMEPSPEEVAKLDKYMKPRLKLMREKLISDRFRA